MAEYRSPSGEVLDIPANGVRAIAALGWVPVTPPAPKKEPEKVEPEKAPAKRAPKKK